MGIKVAKFGGSSVADAIQIKKIKDIVEADPERRYIVVSAPGKRFDTDSKVTDLLYSCVMHREHNLPIDQLFQVVWDRFSSMALGLELDIVPELMGDLDRIRKDLWEGAPSDYIVSRGEYLNAKIIAACLGFDFIDAVDLIAFDNKGRLLEEETDRNIAAVLEQHERAVIPGFYGIDARGDIKVFNRGGSDITGALIARGVEAEVYENWTDVSGFLVADPRIVKDPLPIETISYKELRELSYMGASVLHEDAIYPVRDKDIPINIRNTNEPEHPGTYITTQPDIRDDRVITGITGSKEFTIIGLYKNNMATERGFIRRLAGVLEDYNINLEHIPSGIDTVSAIVSKPDIEPHLNDVIEDLERQLQPESIDVFQNISLIAIVGCGMSYRTGVSAKLFTALAENDINIRMIDQGSSEINIIIGVADDDFENAIRTIYEAFIEG